MELFNQLGIDMGYVLIGSVAFCVILLILVIVILAKQSKLKKQYKKFMSGKDAESLEEEILSRFEEVSNIKKKVTDIEEETKKIAAVLVTAYQKLGIVKYDAFKEMGGKLSFALALLNEKNDGFVINSMHSSREGCYTYVKEIIKGESFVVLAEEEKQALDQAMKSKSYME